MFIADLSVDREKSRDFVGVSPSGLNASVRQSLCADAKLRTIEEFLHSKLKVKEVKIIANTIAGCSIYYMSQEQNFKPV